jgi:hypothetical protein
MPDMPGLVVAAPAAFDAGRDTTTLFGAAPGGETR